MCGLAWRCCIRRWVKKRSSSGAKLAGRHEPLPSAAPAAHRLRHQLRDALRYHYVSGTWTWPR